MTEGTSTRNDRWQHLCLITERIDRLSAEIKQGQDRARAMAELDALLESVTEVFSKDVDPVGDFEGYAVRQLVKAIRGWVEVSARF
jgi:hypothetical protein